MTISQFIVYLSLMPIYSIHNNIQIYTYNNMKYINPFFSELQETIVVKRKINTYIQNYARLAFMLVRG